jgi:hypothetical protein
LFPYNDDELRVINNTARAEGLMGARLPSKRYYKEARVAGGFGAAIAFRLAFLKEQIEAGVKIDTVVLLASTEAPPTTGKSTGYWLNNFVDENFPDVAEMKTRAVEVDSSGPVRTQFDVALACAYVILGEKLLDRPQHIPASPGGYYTEKPSPKLGGAKLLVLGAEPSNGKAATYADQAALLEHIDYDRAQPHEPLLHNGTSVYPWFEHQMLRQHTIRVGQRTEIAGYNKVTPRIANFDPPKPRALWENHGDAEDFIQGRHAAETAGNKSRVDSFNDVVPEYVQELSSLIGEAHGLILDIDRFEREQPLESALVL